MNNSIGIKWLMNIYHRFKDDAYTDWDFKEMKKEARLLREASRRTNLFPKYHKFGVFKFKRGFAPALIMEHIDFTKRAKWESEVVSIIKQRWKFKVYYGDHNSNNFVFDIKKKKWRIIDFTPSYVRIKKLDKKKAH